MTSWRVELMLCTVFGVVFTFPDGQRHLKYETNSETNTQIFESNAENDTLKLSRNKELNTEISFKNNKKVNTEEIAKEYRPVIFDNDGKNTAQSKKNENISINIMSDSRNAENKVNKENVRNFTPHAKIIQDYTKNLQDQKIFILKQTSIMPERLSKYFYDSFNPISPFPEIEETDELNSRNSIAQSSYAPYFVQKSHQTPQVAGPLLYPRGIYAREFALPFYY